MREHLKGAVDANTRWAILDVERLYWTIGDLAVEVDLQPFRKEDAVGVGLDNPVVAPVPAVSHDQVPSPDEIVSV